MYLVCKKYFLALWHYCSSNSSCNVHGLYTVLRWPINISRGENIGIREIVEPMSGGTKEAECIIIT
jgi:hypothetical protein